MLSIKLSMVSQTHLQRGRRTTSMGYIFHGEDPLKVFPSPSNKVLFEETIKSNACWAEAGETAFVHQWQRICLAILKKAMGFVNWYLGKSCTLITKKCKSISEQTGIVSEGLQYILRALTKKAFTSLNNF